MKKNLERQEERIRQRRIREHQNPFALLPLLYAGFRRQGEQLHKITGLSLVEWRTLWDLSEAGPMSVGDLAEIQRTDRSLVSRVLPAMTRRGLVDVQRNSADGRQTIVVITDKGREAYERAAPIMQRRREALRASMTPEEFSALVELLERFSEFLRKPAKDFLPDHQPTEDGTE